MYPSDAVVHIGLSYNSYSLLNAPVDVEQMSNCISLPGPLAQGIDLERQCQPGASGRYVYVFIERRSGNSQLDIWELQMYDDPGKYVPNVNTSNETDACKTTQLSTHVAHAWMVIEWTLLACTNHSQGALDRWLKKYPECKMFSNSIQILHLHIS